MEPHGRSRSLVASVCALALLLLGCNGDDGAAPQRSASPTERYLLITVNGDPKGVPEGVTLGEALKSMGIKARPGHLRDVTGAVIDANAYPAKLRVDGKRASKETVLAEGAEIEVEAGRDRTEPTTSEKERVDEPQQANPQYLLGAAPGWRITTTGQESGKVASIVFEPERLRSPKAVALTFDDGPNASYTPRVLDILDRENAPATFFVLGYLVERYPDIVRRTIREGHVVGSHSWNHPHDFASLTDRKQTRQIEDSVRAIEAEGETPYLFRPPEGSFDAGVVELARKEGLRTVMWSVDPHDYESSSTPRGLTRYVLSHLKPGAIILFHDGGGDQSATVKALPGIIKGIRARGYDLVLLQP